MHSWLRLAHTLSYSLIVLMSVTAQAQWIPSSGRPVSNSSIKALGVFGSKLLAGGISHIFVTSDQGTSWTQADSGIYYYGQQWSVGGFAVCQNKVFVGTHWLGVYCSTDDGASWISVNNGLSYQDISCLAVVGSTLFSGTVQAGIVAHSSDFGLTWQETHPGGLTFNNVFALSSVGQNVFVGSWFGFYKSTTMGSIWEHVLLPGQSAVYSLVYDGQDLFGGTYSSVYRSTDMGTTWTQSGTGLPSSYITSLVTFGQTLIAGMPKGGVYISRDKGKNWHPANEGLGTLAVNAIVFQGTDLYAATDSLGVWRRPLSEVVTSVEDRPSTQPMEFALEQNYPNPFNPLTTIKYTIAGAGSQGPGARKTMLVIYDVLGRQVATLVDEVKEPGSR